MLYQAARRVRSLGLVASLTLAGAVACTSAGGMTPSASATTTTRGWEHYFKLDWQVEPAGPQSRKVEGYLYNEYGRPATDVRVLVQALDEDGRVVGQKLGWVPGEVPPLSRSYFEVDGLPPADQYRVTVWSFDFLEGPHRQL